MCVCVCVCGCVFVLLHVATVFHVCENFNQDLSHWDVSNVVYMRGMFHAAIKFDFPKSNNEILNILKSNNFKIIKKNKKRNFIEAKLS